MMVKSSPYFYSTSFGYFVIELSVHFDDDVYVIEEHQLVLPITVIAERPALVEYDVLVHPVVTGSNATGLYM